MSGARLAALSLIVPDYDPAIAFFRAALGFEVCEDIPQGAKRWVTLQCPGGGARLVLARAEGPEQVGAGQAGRREALHPPRKALRIISPPDRAAR